MTMIDALLKPSSSMPSDDRKALLLAHEKRRMEHRLRSKGYSKAAAVRRTNEHFSKLGKENENVAQ